MKKIILLLFISFQSCNIIAQKSNSIEIEKQIELVENNLRGRVKVSNNGFNIIDRMKYYNVNGLSIAVIQDYKLVWSKGYGCADIVEKRPVTNQTLFQAASNSKSLNSMAVLKLVQDQKLDLYTDINKYLKSWQFPYNTITKDKKINLADLLSHTAGLNAVNFPGYDRKAKLPSIPEVLDGKKPSNTVAVRSEFEPEIKFQYSGGGTTIARLIVSDVTEQPYDKFMYENILKPLGMVNSFFTQPPPKDKIKLLATGYHIDGSEVNNKFKVYPEQGPDGLWTTPSEMANFVIETMLAYSGKSAKILNQEMTQLQLTPYHDESSALGIFIQKRENATYFTHGAGNEGYAGQYYGSLVEGNGVVVYSNSDNRAIINEVVNSVATVYHWRGFCDTTVRKVIDLPDSITQKYIGVYLYDNTLATIFKTKDGYYYNTDKNNLKMYFSDELNFFNQESLSDKTFNIDSLGNIIGFRRSSFGKALPIAKKVKSPDSLYLKNFEFENLAWQFFENGKYDDAIAYCKRGLQLYPEDEILLYQMAHAYLYNKDYDKAIAIYNTQLKLKWAPESKWEKNMQRVLIYFKESGYDVKIFDKVFNDLKIKKPKGY